MESNNITLRAQCLQLARNLNSLGLKSELLQLLRFYGYTHVGMVEEKNLEAFCAHLINITKNGKFEANGGDT